jgi:hypothetical protein
LILFFNKNAIKYERIEILTVSIFGVLEIIIKRNIIGLMRFQNFFYSKKVEVKNFFRKKISSMLYDDVCIYYEEKNYMKSINRYENGIKDDYMIDDVNYPTKNY